jgi:hypothetical protein
MNSLPRRLLPILFLGCLLPAILSAAEVAGLYEAQVPVESREAAHRGKALADALLQVLVKVTGQRGLALRPAVADALENAIDYMQQYRYVEVGGQAPDADGTAGRGMEMWVRFDPVAVNRLLERRGLTMWGQERPQVLVWLAVEQSGRRQVMASESDLPLRRALEQGAARRGLSLLFPLMDLEERALVRFGDLWGGFADGVLEASARYGARTVLVGRALQGRDGFWQGRWQLYIKGQEVLNISAPPGSMEDLVTAGVDEVADALAARYSVTVGAGETVQWLRVTDVEDFQGYIRVLDYLQGLTPVTRVHPARIVDGTIEFELDIRGAADGLRRLIELGSILAPLAGDRLAAGEVLEYRLLP